jgi:hypothetical protein
MKKKLILNRLLLLLILIVSKNVFSQQTSKFSFEIETGYNSFSMNNLNRYYIDTFAKKNNLLEKKIEKGKSFTFLLKYQFVDLIDFGIYGNYQFGNSNGHPIFVRIDDFGNVIDKHEGNYDFKTEGLSVGLSNSFYISHLLKFRDKKNKFLNRLKLATEIDLGYGIAKATSILTYPTLEGSFPNISIMNSKDLQGKFSLKMEYEYLKNPIISSIGFKFGYQYFKTKTLKDYNSSDWRVMDKYPINLDFSGIYASFFVNVGK